MTIPGSPPPDQSPGPASAPKALEPDRAVGQPPEGGGRSFASYMGQPAPGATATPTTGTTGPMNLVQPPNPQGTPTLDTLMTQAKTAQDSIGVVGQQLNTPNLKLKRSQAHLLKNKLTDAGSNAKAVTDKLGLDVPQATPSAQGGPLDRFLTYISNGENQFAAIQDKLQEVSKSGQQLNAADMLFIQVKMSLAQQEIEYSSTLLSKVISSMTTIMNIQL